MSETSKAAGFSKVFRAEIRQIAARRQSFESRELQFDSNPNQPETIHAEEHDGEASPRELEQKRVYSLQSFSLCRDLSGLAISGGGIRSATFGLGIIQGLAKAAVLPRFDYLSTVSGGGYVGSFLSKWIHEKSFDQVEAGLAGTDATGHPVVRNMLRIHSRESGSKEINHLRQYSNYLAPSPGLFSVDGWLLLAIYVRNLFLNQTVLFTGALALILFIRFVAEVFCLASADSIQLSFGVFAIVLVMMSGMQIVLMSLFRLSCDKPTEGLASRVRPNHWWIGSRITAVLLAVFASLFVEFDDRVEWYEDHSFWLLTLLQTAAFGILALLGYKQDEPLRQIGSCLFGAIGGFIGGGLAALILTSTTQAVASNLTFSVPTIVVMFVVSEMIYVGLAGLLLDEFDREWWSSLNSRLLLFSFVWIILFSLVVLSPWAFGKLIYNTDWSSLYSQLAILAGSIGTIGTILSGLIAARSSKTDGKKKSKISEILAAMAPAVFLGLLFSLVSIAVCWIFYDFFTKSQGGIYHGFLDSLKNGSYFEDLNSPTPPWLGIPAWLTILVSAALATLVSVAIANRVGVNTFSLHNMYANRLIRCYLGATTPERKANALTNFDPQDDVALSKLTTCKVRKGATRKEREECELGPLHIINGAVNRSSQGSSLSMTEEELAEVLLNQDRLSESFVFTPLNCGCESTGYRPTKEFAEDVKLGQALAVSGAAVSPNMGYHSSPAITALLTVFNLRLGAWFGNPASDEAWKFLNPRLSWKLLWNEFMGNTNTSDRHVYVSDGGHFENMGVYELIRRRCRFIVAIDADAAPRLHENMGRLVRMARIDFGVRIEIDSTAITPNEDGISEAHVVVGRIHYGDVHKPDEEQPPHDPSYLYDNNQGIIVWIALSVTGDEPADVRNYRAMNTDFPYRTTGDQFFDENEFESYRELGEHSVESVLRQCTLPVKPGTRSKPWDTDRNTFAFVLENKQNQAAYLKQKENVAKFINTTSTKDIFKSIFDKWLDQPSSTEEFVAFNEDYVLVLEKLRFDPNLSRLADYVCGPELKSSTPTRRPKSEKAEMERAERMMVGEMMKLLENVWVAFDFQDNFLHPIHRGWLNIFRLWTGNPVFEEHWFGESIKSSTGIQCEFNPDFRRFIEAVRRIENSSVPDSYDLPERVKKKSPFLRERKAPKRNDE